jgi:mono/diheme cytochrome c family protein
MPSGHRLKLAAYGLALAVSLAWKPAVAADADNGEHLARRWCVGCHVVASNQRRPTTDAAPPFATIATKPGFDAARVARFLLDPHPKMPNMSLTRSEAADLAAYIQTTAK